MMAFLRDISKSVIQYLNLSMKSKAILFSLYFIYSRNSKFSLSALLDNLSFSWRWIIIDSFWCWFYFLFSMLDRGYFKGIKSQQVLLWDEQDPKLAGCLFSPLFMVLVHTPITSSFSQDIHSFASSVERTLKSFRKCFSNVRFYFFLRNF